MIIFAFKINKMFIVEKRQHSRQKGNFSMLNTIMKNITHPTYYNARGLAFDEILR
jgi:hypothetical protein